MAVMTYLFDIHAEECADLLATATLGRLGVVVDGHPEIFPVNHVYDRESGRVLFPTNARTKLHAALEWPWVAFEVDGTEPDGGWSVLVVGRAELIADPSTVARAVGQRQVPWAAGEGVVWVGIVPTKVTGRRVCASGEGISVAVL